MEFDDFWRNIIVRRIKRTQLAAPHGPASLALIYWGDCRNEVVWC